MRAGVERLTLRRGKPRARPIGEAEKRRNYLPAHSPSSHEVFLFDAVGKVKSEPQHMPNELANIRLTQRIRANRERQC